MQNLRFNLGPLGRLHQGSAGPNDKLITDRGRHSPCTYGTLTKGKHDLNCDRLATGYLNFMQNEGPTLTGYDPKHYSHFVSSFGNLVHPG